MAPEQFRKHWGFASIVNALRHTPAGGARRSKKKPTGDRWAESISLEENRGDRTMMLQRAIECKFLLMMIEITAVNKVEKVDFLAMLQCVPQGAWDTLRHCVHSGRGRKQGGSPWLPSSVTAK